MQKGFTLIELIVIIAIIITLSSVVFASLSKARGSSHTECRKENSVEYCAGKAGITVKEFENLENNENKPCNR